MDKSVSLKISRRISLCFLIYVLAIGIYGSIVILPKAKIIEAKIIDDQDVTIGLLIIATAFFAIMVKMTPNDFFYYWNRKHRKLKRQFIKKCGRIEESFNKEYGKLEDMKKYSNMNFPSLTFIYIAIMQREEILEEVFFKNSSKLLGLKRDLKFLYKVIGFYNKNAIDNFYKERKRKHYDYGFLKYWTTGHEIAKEFYSEVRLYNFFLEEI
ncbi:hypothetical protein BKH42_03445 [Helicobacter sp. 13S00482-2]|uniref:hypothetical protein n=1 Tax=Helicobacter sp. 13S00482-2 TaxID=1476200 RepID=UPI000BA6CABD|nr:hypothetical protein [Helicobacter sp. 13S00482-2]PAF53795.1 hypothetical protein BKH42_03445 [Helicobacter sp. 13S00482-2]